MTALRLIEEPAEGTRSVLAMTEDFPPGQPLITQEGWMEFYEYGSCGRVLIQAPLDNIENIVIHCNCGAYNESEAA